MALTITTTHQQRQFCTFFIADHLFGVNITDVREIHPLVKITPVHHALANVKGFVNIRGHIHLIIDMRQMLGYEQSPTGVGQLVLFKPHIGESFGGLVDRVGDVAEVRANQIENPDPHRQKTAETDSDNNSVLISGFCKLNLRMLIILDSARLIEHIRLAHQNID